MNKNILILLIGNLRYDGRVQKTISSLQKENYKITLISTEFSKDDNLSDYNFPIHIIKKKTGGVFFKKIYRAIVFYLKVRRKIKDVSPDYLHCNDFSTLIYAFGFFSKTKVIYDSHELAIETSDGITKSAIRMIEKLAVSRCYKIILPQFDRLNYFYFLYQNKIKKEQLYLLENFPKRTLHLEDNYFLKKYNFQVDKSQYKILSYTGIINSERSIDTVIKALIDIPNIIFFIIGSVNETYYSYLLKIITENNLKERVFIKSPVPNNEMLSIANSSDIGVCFYSDNNLNSYFCASNKIYEYINCNKLVLSNNIAGTTRIINDNNGVLIDKINETSIRSALLKLINLDVVNTSHKHYYWDDQEYIFKKIYI